MIQRWTFDGPPAYPYENGGYVTYADHVAAVAAAEQRGREYALSDEEKRLSSLYQQGIKAARDAVADPAIWGGEAPHAALAAIDALPTRGEGSS